jgi:hypothetical protein
MQRSSGLIEKIYGKLSVIAEHYSYEGESIRDVIYTYSFSLKSKSGTVQSYTNHSRREKKTRQKEKEDKEVLATIIIGYLSPAIKLSSLEFKNFIFFKNPNDFFN